MKLVKLSLLIALFCAISLFSAEVATALDDWIFVDLKEKSNTFLVKHQWWTKTPGDSTLSLLPIDKVADFEGPDGKVKFQIIDGAIVVFGTNAAQWPKEVEGIVVEGKAKFIYFLHATGWEQNGVPSYVFVMNYRDGKRNLS